MKDLHIIFNIDYKNKFSQLNFFRESILRQIRKDMIEIPTIEQFKTLISRLEECKCYIWVHPSYASELVQEGLPNDILNKVIPELDSMNLEYKRITRTNNIRSDDETYNVNQMPVVMKGMRYYHTSELRKMIAKKEEMDLKDNIENQSKKVLIVTATQIEAKTFFSIFEKKRKKAVSNSIKNITYWNFGQIGNSSIFMIKQSDMGSLKVSGSMLTINEAIDTLNPDYIIMVGIAYGLKKDKQEIGQILISRELENYESAKILRKEKIPRAPKIPAGTLLKDRFDNASIKYKKSKVEMGFIVSGDSLVDSKEFVDELKDRYPEAIGGEMEGTGLQSSCEKQKKEWILIKGICDWGYNKQHPNKDKDQELAINNVCDFLIYTLKNFNF